MKTDSLGNPFTGVLFGSEARSKLATGAKIATDAVGCTLGPKGKTVLIQRSGAPLVLTKDGVTVSKSINLSDPVMRMGAELLREAASRTNDAAGDGTTTATVLAYAMIKEGMKLLATGQSQQKLCRGIELAQQKIDEYLQVAAVPVKTVDEVVQVATVSANGDSKLGTLIADAFGRVGREGIVTVEDAKGTATTLDVVEGMQFDRGYLSPYFVTNTDRMHTVYVDCRVLVTDKKLSDLRELIPILERVVGSAHPLLIIADDIDGDALQGLVLNRVKASLPVVCVKAPGFGQHKEELLGDICTLVGATMVSSKTGVSLSQLRLEELGVCKRVTVDAKSTTLVTDGSTATTVKARVTDLQLQLSDVTLSEDESEKLRRRIAALAGGVAVIRVGGATEIEMVERRYRIEDALNATRAASVDGIVPGGGAALFEAAKHIDLSDVTDDEVKAGANIVRRACSAPLETIVENAGLNSSVVMDELKRAWEHMSGKLGYDATNGRVVDMFEAGIIDPARVTRVALRNAASVASAFVSLDAVVFNESEDK